VSDTAYTDPTLYERTMLPEDYWRDTLDLMINKYHLRTAFDFGCGLGVDVWGMLQAGLDVYGVDGKEELRDHVLFESERYMVRDLTDIVTLKADLVWCREVAEHIESCWAGRLVRNITRSAERAIYFTAAPPGQVGHQHINLRPRGYWQGLFRAAGWKVDRKLTDFNRRNNPNEDDRKNGMVLCPVK